MRLGFVGLGELGGHLAASLARAGFDLVVHDRDRGRADRHLAMGAGWAPSIGALARDRDAVLTCLPSPAASRTVLAELLETLPRGATWIELSTLGRDDIQALAGLAACRSRIGWKPTSAPPASRTGWSSPCAGPTSASHHDPHAGACDWTHSAAEGTGSAPTLPGPNPLNWKAACISTGDTAPFRG